MDGEPGKYLAAVFSLVVSGASSYLEQLNSTFRIVADPNEPLGLRFYDLTNMEGGAQPHTKLSGAQRVRTSVAFLLALHDIVVPDLGLLVLDEPSNHLDEAAVFDLRNLLLKLRPVLAQRGAQLWVIDHEPAIQGAADIVVPLKAQTADAP
jgi:DNA repair exonuclease SbcCD ATPase subunit